MKVRYVALWLLIVVVTGFQCQKDNIDGPGEVEMVFRAYWEGQPVVMNTAVAYPGDVSLRFAELDFLLSNARLLAADGTSYPVGAVHLINFTESARDAAGAEQGFRLTVKDVPAGQYVGLVLGIGLDAATNATRPQDYPSLYPLGVAGNRYWEAWSSYIFSKLQGLADMDQSGVYNKPFAYHAGGTPLYRELTFMQPVRIFAGDRTVLAWDLDVKRLFATGTDSWWDVRMVSSAHSPDHPAMLVIMDNYADALQLR